MCHYYNTHSFARSFTFFIIFEKNVFFNVHYSYFSRSLHLSLVVSSFGHQSKGLEFFKEFDTSNHTNFNIALYINIYDYKGHCDTILVWFVHIIY